MNKEKVLIIEDELDLLDLIDFNLTRKGFVTEGALDGRDGLEKIDSFNPDVIILDLILPGVDGWEICANLRKSKKEIPLIMLTAKSMPEDKVRGLEAGAADYMTKPFNMKELVIRIDKLLEKKRKRDAQDILFHEVENRITTIGCCSNLLSRKAALQDGNVARYLDTINHQVACAFESIAELKVLANFEAGEWTLKSERCCVAAIVRQAADSCKAAAELKSIKISMEGAEIAPAVSGDGQALRQVFMNIMANAVKYAAEKSTVEVDVKCCADGLLSVSIKDEGPGIPAGDLPHIFEKGFRAGNARGVAGSGIGLYGVKKLLDAMGAKIEARSVPGKGSEFTILFPAGRPRT